MMNKKTVSRRKVTYPSLFIAEATPKIPFCDARWNEQASENYNGMDAYYSEYRRDSLVRNSINALAYFSTTKGFNAVLDLTNPADLDEAGIIDELKQYGDLRDYIDAKNKEVNLDNVLNVAVIKNKIYGWVGFEFVKNKKDDITLLLPRETERSNKRFSMGLIPIQNRMNGELEGFSYSGKAEKVFEPDDILWFTNNALEYDFRGESEIEPIFDQLGTRRYITNEAFKETAKAMWAPYPVVKVDTGRANEDDAKSMLSEIANGLQPGKALVHNGDIEAQVIDQKPHIDKLVTVLESIDQDIIGNFRVPRFLLGREKQFNRATAFAEGALFLQGPIADIQKYMAREIERQWYDRLLKNWFTKNRGWKEGTPLPVKVKHIWNPVTMNDWVEQVKAWTELFNSGIANRKMALDGIGEDSESVIQEEEEKPEINAETTSLVHQITDGGGNEYTVKTIKRGKTRPLLENKSKS
jgi:hypothetical protein